MLEGGAVTQTNELWQRENPTNSNVGTLRATLTQFWWNVGHSTAAGSSGSQKLLSIVDFRLTFWCVWQYPLQAEHRVCP